ncbi:MAG: hypothetical protein D6160_08220 [Ketobacter sp.]|nr:MAG: hypothetical protein D6160_08220 [Ketobacter sp.]
MKHIDLTVQSRMLNTAGQKRRLAFRHCLTRMGALLLWLCLSTSTQALTFEQPVSGDGTIAIDAENFSEVIASHDNALWMVSSTAEAITGSTAQAPLSAQSHADFANNNARIDYNINFTQTGTYHLWMRGYAANGTSDTLYVGLNGAPLSSAFFRFLPYKTWIWTDLKQGGSYFSIDINNPGVHTLNLWMRETGTMVDRIVLSKNSNSTPAGDGPAETPHDGAGNPDPEPDTVATPQIVPNGGLFQGSVEVSLASSTSGAAIYYTLDGSQPDAGAIAYNAPFTLIDSTQVRAIAIRDGYLNSEQVSVQFTATVNQAPTLESISNQTVQAGNTVRFSAQASDADSGTPHLAASDLPAGASFTDQGNGTGFFEWTPSSSDTGQHLITITATDAADAALVGQTQTTITVETPDTGTGNTEGAVFNESGGLVVMEGEHFTNVATSHDNVFWNPINTTEAIANSAVQAPLSAQSTSNFANNHARVDYDISFTQTGTYHLWMRGYAANGASDTLYVGLNGAPLSTAFFRFLPYKTWIWTDLKQGGSYFSIDIENPGVHTLNLWMRETGTIVDRIVLSKDSALTPSGDGPAESSRNGGTDPAPDVVATPTINPDGGSFQGSIDVSIASSTPGATIYYTLNGSRPGTGSTAYNAPFTLTESAQVRAIAVMSNYQDSEVISAQFTATINQAPTLAPINDLSVVAGNTINFTAQASDVDSATPTLSANNLPAGATFTDLGNGNAQFEWTPTASDVGSHQITIIATDATDSALTSQIQTHILVEAPDPGTGGSAGMTFNESGGLVVIEGEHFSSVNASHDNVNWNAINNNAAVENSAVQAPLTAQSTSDFSSDHARVDYNINFTQTGTYHLWMRGYAPDGASDTLYVGLNGTPLSTAFFRFLPYKTWIWTDLKQGGSFFSIDINSPGVHTLNLWMRETGTIVDRIVLSKDSAVTPSGDGPAESTQSGSTDPDPDPQPETIPGVTHYWQFNDTSSTVFSNRAGGSAHCSDCPSGESGPFEQALSFNGSGDILTADYDSRLAWQANSSITLEAWIKHSSSCLTAETVIGRNDNLSGMSWWLGCDDGKAAFFMSDSSGNNSGLLSGTSTIDDNQWHHIAVVKDGFDQENRLYVDGQLEAIQSASYATTFMGNSTPLTVGGLLNAQSNAYFSGQIDEVAIHNRALPPKTLSQHHADGDIGLQRGLIGCDGGIDVMPLGDSNTRGNGSIPRYSYRPYLYNSLDVAGYDLDFIGSLSESYPVGFQYDHDHEGHSGFTPKQIANNVINWLSLATPDVVLLHIGTNEHNVPDVETILDYIDLVDEDIIVVLAKIINESVYNPATSEFNNQLEAMALARTHDKILIVDQEPALNYVDDMDDNLHANNAGYAKMADVWYQPLSEFLPVCKPTIPQVSSASTHTVDIGETLTLAMDHVGYPQPTFSLQTRPSGMKINPDTGVISWTPAASGSYAVVVKAENGEGQGSVGFSIVVE